MWMTAQSFAVKVSATLGNLILMALLIPEDWGIAALALSVKALLDVTGRIGMRQILVQRHAKFNRWATPAFWLTLTAGMAASTILVGISPVMAMVYGEPKLTWMLIILAANSPIMAVGMIPQSRLQIQMRFRAIAAVEFIAHLGALIATVILAWLGFGPLSFVIPLPFMEIVRSAAFWYFARPRIRLTPQFRRWKLLLGDTSYLLSTDILTRVVAQADYLILGIFHPTPLVGAYSVAFRLSLQSLAVVTGNLRQALFPALSKLQTDAPRLLRAFIRASKVLTAVYTPVALLQAATCDPLLRLLYGTTYLEVIPILQILSLSLVLRTMIGPSVSLLRAQGRFRTNLIIQVWYTVWFVAVALFTSAMWAAIELAIGVSLLAAAFGPLQIYIAIRPNGGTWKDVLDIYRQPITAGVIAFAIAWSSRWLIPPALTGTFRYVAEIAIITLLGGGLYAAILRWFMPQLWFELLEQIQKVVPIGRRS